MTASDGYQSGDQCHVGGAFVMRYPVRLWPMIVRFWLRERLPRWVAMRLPRKVALFAFIRVYAVLGTCGPEYDAAYREWERRSG